MANQQPLTNEQLKEFNKVLEERIIEANKDKEAPRSPSLRERKETVFSSTSLSPTIKK